MRLGADAYTGSNIPASFNNSNAIVLGYDNWDSPDWWERFPLARKVRIATNASQHGLQYCVLDVERYDATVEQAPGWIREQQAIGRSLGKQPWATIYIQESNLAALQEACKGLSYYIWLAWWGHPQAVPGTVGIQCDGQVGGSNGYDGSNFYSDSWQPVS